MSTETAAIGSGPVGRAMVAFGALSLVTACGGGSGGGSGGVSVVAGAATPAPAPAPSSPSPSPTATPAPSFPSPPFGVTADQRFELFGWSYRDGSSEPLPVTAEMASLAWSSRQGTYELSLAGIGAGTLRYSFPGNNPFAFSLADSNGVLPVSVTLKPGNFYDPTFKSTGLIYWAQDKVGGRRGKAVFGLPANASDAPASGTIRYLTVGIASGGADLTFDYGAGTFSGNIGVAWEDDWGPYTPVRYELVSTAFDRATMTFSARFAVPGAPSEGILQGRFFGRGATELALWWRAPIRNPYTGEWTVTSNVSAGQPYCAYFVNAPCDSK